MTLQQILFKHYLVPSSPVTRSNRIGKGCDDRLSKAEILILTFISHGHGATTDSVVNSTRFSYQIATRTIRKLRDLSLITAVSAVVDGRKRLTFFAV